MKFFALNKNLAVLVSTPRFKETSTTFNLSITHSNVKYANIGIDFDVI